MLRELRARVTFKATWTSRGGASRDAQNLLEVDLERKLENSRLSVGPGQSAEVRVRDTRVRKTEVGAVERIERFKPELGVPGLTQKLQREAPHQRHIEIRKAGALEGVSAQVSNTVRSRILEPRFVEVRGDLLTFRPSGIEDWTARADQVHAPAGDPRQNIPGGIDPEETPTHQREDAAQLPVTGDGFEIR